MSARSTPRILLSAAAHRRFWPLLHRRVPGARAVLAGDGARWAGPIEADVGWVTFDAWNDPEHRLFAGLVAARGLQWCQSAAAGLDGEPYDTLRRRGVCLVGSHTNADGVADFALRAGLDALQQAGRWREAQRRRGWERHRFLEMRLTTWLVVGLGAVGRGVVARALACGADVIGCRRDTAAGATGCRLVVAPAELLDVVASAHVVVLAAPAGPATGTIVDARFLAAMRDQSVLVNVARGSLVDEPALLRCLDAGRPARAVLDTCAVEPLPEDSPLWSHPRVELTPHNAGAGIGAEDAAADAFADNLVAWAAGAPLHGGTSVPD